MKFNCPTCKETALPLQARSYTKPRVAITPENWRWCETCDNMIQISKMENLQNEKMDPTTTFQKNQGKFGKFPNVKLEVVA